MNKILSGGFDNKYVVDVNLDDANNRKNINKYLKNSFNLAFNLIRNRLTNKLINGPINKNIFLINEFLGITEFVSKILR